MTSIEDEHIPLMFLPPGLSKPIARKLIGIGQKISDMFPESRNQLRQAGLKVTAKEYFALGLTNALFLSILFTSLMVFVMFVQGRPALELIRIAFSIFFGIFLIFFLLYWKYPGILATKRAEMVDQDLVFALKDLVLQISSGVVLYEAFLNIAESDYKGVADDFKKIIKRINSGSSTISALEELALNTQSQYMKRIAWQIINSLKSGSNLKFVLNRIIKDLTEEQKTKIRNYARELNLWSLVYMLFAVAVPSIGSTMLVILSSFAGFGISQGVFIMFIVISMIIQVILVGFVKSRRPQVGI